ncbi:MAG: cobalamin biosynthesis protein CbiX [Roseovarius sp.]|nr:cobalamin biosynthesis protein CbiX [Roseovarius sp.]
MASALPGWHVGAATLAKSGALDTALADAGSGALVYPLFMTEGWFTREALRARLSECRVRVLPPYGRDPGLPAMAADLVAGVLRDKGWPARETRLFIAAHGSGRSPDSARDTHAFRDALAELAELAEIRVGFVEEPPFLADQAFDLGATSICLPFFAAQGGHVTDDIPEALELAQFEGVLLDPIGCVPGAPVIVAAALRQAVEAPGPA